MTACVVPSDRCHRTRGSSAPSPALLSAAPRAATTTSISRYHVMHLHGNEEPQFPIERFSELLDELREADDDHPGVAVTHESEWSLGVFQSGLLVLEHLEHGAPMHIRGPLDRAIVLDLMRAVAEGRIDDARVAAWQPGYSPPEP